MGGDKTTRSDEERAARRERWTTPLFYALAVAGTAASYALTQGLPNVFGRMPFASYLVIGGLVTLFGGLGPGLLMTILSVAAWVANPPTGPLAIVGAALLAVPTVLFIHRHRQTVRAVRTSERRYAQLCEISSDIILTDDIDGHVVTISEGAAGLAGYSPEQVIGRPSVDFVVAEDRERVLEARRRLLSSGAGEVVSFEVRLIRADGSIRVADVRSGLATVHGRAVGFHTVVRDITDHHLLERQVRQGQKMEAIGRLAGGVAHDFKNLLTAIRGFVDLAHDGLGSDHPAAADLREARRCCSQASDIVGQLLAFSRRQDLRPMVIDTNETLASLEPMLRRLLGASVSLECRYGDGVGHIRVDPHQLTQVLLNLAMNARDAMPSGGRIEIATTEETVRPDSPARPGGSLLPGRYVVVSVSDTGSGIQEATLPHIFEPFFTTKSEGEGTGLGLATVYGIVQQSEGYIGVESDVGRGTRFTVYFPRVR